MSSLRAMLPAGIHLLEKEASVRLGAVWGGQGRAVQVWQRCAKHCCTAVGLFSVPRPWWLGRWPLNPRHLALVLPTCTEGPLVPLLPDPFLKCSGIWQREETRRGDFRESCLQQKPRGPQGNFSCGWLTYNDCCKIVWFGFSPGSAWLR